MHTLLTLQMGCAIFSLKFIPRTVEAKITAVMPSQRACNAENQARYTLSNAPPRMQRNAFAQSILRRAGIRQLPVDMMVSPPSAGVTVNSMRTADRFFRIAFVLDRLYRSVGDAFVCVVSSFGRTPKELFFLRRSCMNILPPLESVKGITARKQYDLLPLSCEILSGFITPHRGDARSQKCVCALLYARIRAGGRPPGPLHAFGL